MCGRACGAGALDLFMAVQELASVACSSSGVEVTYEPPFAPWKSTFEVWNLTWRSGLVCEKAISFASSISSLAEAWKVVLIACPTALATVSIWPISLLGEICSRRSRRKSCWRATRTKSESVWR